MIKQKRNRVLIFGGTLVFLIITYFSAQMVVKSKIESLLANKLPETMQLSYENLTVNLLKGKVEITHVNLTNYGETIKQPNAIIKLEKLSINGFGYWSFLVNNLIGINNISINKPEVTYYQNPLIPKEEYQGAKTNNFDKEIRIKEVKLNNGWVKVLDSETDSLKLQTENIDLKLEKIVYNKNTKTREIPVDFGNYQITFNSFFAQLGAYENVKINKAELNNEMATLRDVSMLTKYSRKTLSEIIPVERDHYNLEIDSLTIKQPKLETSSNSRFLSEKIDFYQPVFKVYRDKLIADDETIKPLYSKMLRDLDFDLSIDQVEVHDAFISYEEKVKADRKAGLISFSKFYATINQVSNTYKEPTKTSLHINTLFMEHSPLKVLWTFDVNNHSDLFEFKAEMDVLQASYLNSFTEANLNIHMKGQLDKTYFTISGTDNASNIDFKVKYKAFDIIALKEDGKEKNEFLSDVINLFISKDSKSKTDVFKEVSKTHIERHKTQSVFNFIWISTKAGLLKAMTID
ncbi:MAG: hypothetical protein ABI295_03815 [Xanthomarina sp.]